MDAKLVERLREEMKYELARTSPPESFPPFPDIPGGRYNSEEFYDLEMTHLWPKVWKYAGRAEELPDEGSYLLCDWFPAQILLIRGDDGQVRAFYNSCRHRGAPVVRGSCGTQRRFRCQYHSWCYDTRGTLVSVPDERDFVELRRSERSLVEIRCEIFDGWIFINEDLDAQPLLDFLGPVAREMAQFKGDNMRVLHRRSITIPCNWKVTIEAFLEINHYQHIHKRDGFIGFDARAATMGLLPGGNSRMVVPLTEDAAKRANMKDVWDWNANARPGMTDIDGVHPIVRSTSVSYLIFPNTAPLVSPHGFPFLFAVPVDRKTTRLEIIHYVPDWGDGEPPQEWIKQLAGFARTIDEDVKNMEPMQRSLDSPGLTGIPISYQERRIWHLHETIDQVIGIDRIPERLRVAQLLQPHIER